MKALSAADGRDRNYTRTMRRTIIASIIVSLAFVGAGCLGGQEMQLPQVSLQYWRYDDPAEAVAPIVDAYRQAHPNVKIEVRSFRAEEYEHELLVALAENRGPDIFSLPNVWLTGWRSKLLPLPEKTVVPAQTVDPASKKVIVANVETKTITVRQINEDFVEAVPSDIIQLTVPQTRDERPVDAVWGLPLSLDTLAMFYNQDLLRQADIKDPPKTWKDLQDQVKRLTVLDGKTIRQSGAAIGLSDNVRHSTDLITTIMLQNGAELADSRGQARFHSYTVETRGRPYPPGTETLMFYQAFARPGMSTYTWDTDLPDSTDAFIAGKTAITFGYPHDRNEIRERAPRLNFGVAPLPQVDPAKSKSIASYPVEVVSKWTKFPNEAWDFVQFAARPEQVAGFLTATGRPTALRSLISNQLTDPNAAPFVGQVLTAESWYRGNDWEEADRAIGTMIETYPTPEDPDYQPIIQVAASAVSRTAR
ncbi:MAG: extracellular solute-binding protein [bacterium]